MTEQPLTLSYVLHALAFGAGMWVFITAPLWIPKLRSLRRHVDEALDNVVPLPDRSNVHVLHKRRVIK